MNNIEEFRKVEKPEIGEKYHVSFASNGVQGRCIKIDEEKKEVILQSPKSKMVWKKPVKFEQLYHLRGE